MAWMCMLALAGPALAFAQQPAGNTQAGGRGPGRPGEGDRGGGNRPPPMHMGSDSLKTAWQEVNRDECFAALDADGDGSISKDEFSAAKLDEIFGTPLAKALGTSTDRMHRPGRSEHSREMGGGPGQGQMGQNDRPGQMGGPGQGQMGENGPPGQMGAKAQTGGAGQMPGQMGMPGATGKQDEVSDEMRAQRTVQAWDLDNDGKLSETEFLRGEDEFKTILATADEDGDQKLSVGEYVKYLTDSNSTGQIGAGARDASGFAKLDANGDGIIARDECPSVLYGSLVRRFDRNHDSKVTLDELRSAQKSTGGAK